MDLTKAFGILKLALFAYRKIRQILKKEKLDEKPQKDTFEQIEELILNDSAKNSQQEHPRKTA